jgi:hypothetical protein
VWPFRRRTLDADQHATGPVYRAARQEWKQLGPIQPVQALRPATFDAEFEGTLATRRDPSFLAPLGHYVAPAAPHGRVTATARRNAVSFAPAPVGIQRQEMSFSPARPAEPLAVTRERSEPSVRSVHPFSTVAPAQRAPELAAPDAVESGRMQPAPLRLQRTVSTPSPLTRASPPADLPVMRIPAVAAPPTSAADPADPGPTASDTATEVPDTVPTAEVPDDVPGDVPGAVPDAGPADGTSPADAGDRPADSGDVTVALTGDRPLVQLPTDPLRPVPDVAVTRRAATSAPVGQAVQRQFSPPPKRPGPAGRPSPPIGPPLEPSRAGSSAPSGPLPVQGASASARSPRPPSSRSPLSLGVQTAGERTLVARSLTPDTQLTSSTEPPPAAAAESATAPPKAVPNREALPTPEAAPPAGMTAATVDSPVDTVRPTLGLERPPSSAREPGTVLASRSGAIAPQVDARTGRVTSAWAPATVTWPSTRAAARPAPASHPVSPSTVSRLALAGAKTPPHSSGPARAAHPAASAGATASGIRWSGQPSTVSRRTWTNATLPATSSTATSAGPVPSRAGPIQRRSFEASPPIGRQGDAVAAAPGPVADAGWELADGSAESVPTPDGEPFEAPDFVQRQADAAPEPAPQTGPATVTATATSGPAAAAPAGRPGAAPTDAEVDKWSRALYPSLRRRLCQDLLLDRERSGYSTDIRY